MTSTFMALGDKGISPSPIFWLAYSSFALGLTSMFFIAIGQWLNFSLHVHCQLGAAIFFLITIGTDTCEHATDTPMGRTSQSVVRMLDTAAQNVLGAMYTPFFRVGGGGIIGSPCIQLALFVQVFMGFGVVSYTVWLLERQARVGFLESLDSELHPMQSTYHLPKFILVVHILLWVVAFGISWRAFLWIDMHVLEASNILKTWKQRSLQLWWLLFR